MKLCTKNFCLGMAIFSAMLPLCKSGYAQGTVQWTVTFDGPPVLHPTDAIFTTNYVEKGMIFTGIKPGGGFGRSGGAEVNEGFPRNGTAYIYAMFTYSLAVRSVSGARFGLVSVDLAEFSTLYAFPAVVQFVGYRPDGSIVTTNLVTDGIIDGAGPLNDFETFYFDSRFADLVRVEVPTHTWSLDNMRFRNIPEPSVFGLVVGGSLLLVAACHRTRRKGFANVPPAQSKLVGHKTFNQHKDSVFIRLRGVARRY